MAHPSGACTSRGGGGGFVLTAADEIQLRHVLPLAEAHGDADPDPVTALTATTSPPACARRRATPTSLSCGRCTPAPATTDPAAPAGLSCDVAAYGNGRREQVCRSSTAIELPTAATVRRTTNPNDCRSGGVDPDRTVEGGNEKAREGTGVCARGWGGAVEWGDRGWEIQRISAVGCG
ncbi:unnamed protein product [Miscanthus lutarioriparius]|uniref:Uncharacterized protein n=1 Tax=Miscanthus lutarioriparius TaxID=422564 RepID=A0A811Q417_9POAL|nr:unnamed protein product [Miscanthus lutarioriparius]